VSSFLSLNTSIESNDTPFWLRILEVWREKKTHVMKYWFKHRSCVVFERERVCVICEKYDKRRTTWFGLRKHVCDSWLISPFHATFPFSFSTLLPSNKTVQKLYLRIWKLQIVSTSRLDYYILNKLIYI